MIFHLTSKKPILLVGNGVRTSGSKELLQKLAEQTDIPVVTTMNAVDLVQGGSKFGFIGAYGNRVANCMIEQCDLLISVGARLGIRQVGHDSSNFAPNAKLIRVDVDQAELARDVKTDEEKYLADAKDFLQLLLEENIPKYTEWKNACLKAREELKDFDKELGNLVIEQISSMLPENPIVAVDVGQNQCWSAQSLNLKGDKGRILIAGGYGAMGCGLPFAIGASISENRKKIFCITGDGGLQMNIQELETVKRENLPIKLLIINNQALGKISEIQLKSYASRFAQTTKDSGYTVPDFEKVAKAYGIKAMTVQYHQDLSQVQNWFEDNEACVINILLPENTMLIPKIDWNTGKVKPEINAAIQKKVDEILG